MARGWVLAWLSRRWGSECGGASEAASAGGGGFETAPGGVSAGGGGFETASAGGVPVR